MSKRPDDAERMGPTSSKEPEVTNGGRVLYDPISVWDSDAGKKHREHLHEVEKRLSGRKSTDDRD